MKFISHYTCIDSNSIRPRMIVEFDDEDRILNLASLDELQHEPAATIFTDGVISGELLAPVNLAATGDALQLIAAATRPLRIGQTNQLLIWKGIDLAARRFTPQSRFTPLRTCAV